MPFVLLIIGAVLLDAGVRDTVTTASDGSPGLFTLLQNDFSPAAQQPGQHSFIPWVVAILIIGALGYVEELRGFSHAMLALVVIVLFLNKKNSAFFPTLQNLFNG